MQVWIIAILSMIFAGVPAVLVERTGHTENRCRGLLIFAGMVVLIRK